MSGKYLTRTQTQTSRTAKVTLSSWVRTPVSPPSPIPTTSAGISVMLWLAGNNSLSLLFFWEASCSIAAVTVWLTTANTMACVAVASYEMNMNRFFSITIVSRILLDYRVCIASIEPKNSFIATTQ